VACPYSKSPALFEMVAAQKVNVVDYLPPIGPLKYVRNIRNMKKYGVGSHFP
jgi:hypothetical protein